VYITGVPAPSTPAARRPSYWEASRAPRYSLLFALPLLLAYEGLAALLSGAPGAGVRNGADVLLQAVLFAVAGRYEPIVFGTLLVGGSIWLIARDLRAARGPLRPRVFAGMLAESAALAVAFGVAVGTVTARLLGALHALAAPAGRGLPAMDVPTRVMVSLGAGLYEELLFRVLLVSALAWLGHRAFRWRRGAAGAFAVVVGALLFSAFHYVGPFGEPLELPSFVFRTVAGLAFSALYVMRGFGITAWTHALYDMLLLVVLAG
jgi:hypothetical protein